MDNIRFCSLIIKNRCSLLHMPMLPITHACAYGLERMCNRVHERMLPITHAMDIIRRCQKINA